MANFPLALSIEPSLLPYARANGFHMDHKAGSSCDRRVSMLSVMGTVPRLRLPEDVRKARNCI